VTTLDQLKQAVIAGDCPLGIYADALEESGRPAEAEQFRSWAKVYPALTETIGNVVRLAADLTRKALARIAGLVTSTVFVVERGTKQTKLKTAEKLAKALGVSVAVLTGEDPLPLGIERNGKQGGPR
jgi:DNA-binding XRE family transcriptional regulator